MNQLSVIGNPATQLEGVVGKVKVIGLLSNPRLWLIRARKQALEFLSNGILRDIRVFKSHTEDPLFFDHLDAQSLSLQQFQCFVLAAHVYFASVAIERNAHNAWVGVGSDIVIREAQDHFHLHGMDAVRPALSATVRSAEIYFLF